jgi:hypothetical protein
MRGRGRSRLSYANVMATIALFLALSGSSYAALKISGKQIKKGTVTSKQIKDHSVRGRDLARGLLASAKAAPLASAAFEASRDAGPSNVPPSTSYTTVATLSDVQSGAYVVFAKTNMASSQTESSRCRLTAGASVDESNRGLRANGTPESNELQLAHVFTSPGDVVLACRTVSGTWAASDTKILAIKVGSATSSGVAG